MAHHGRTPVEISLRNCRRILSAYIQSHGREPGNLNELMAWWWSREHEKGPRPRPLR
jgi:hypothetical protein